MMLGDPGAVSWVSNNFDESFQERAREHLGCYSQQTSSSTHSGFRLQIQIFCAESEVAWGPFLESPDN